MGKIIHDEIEINGCVPQEVMDRVRANLQGRQIDFSDLPELTEWPKQPTAITTDKIKSLNYEKNRKKLSFLR
ncbi:MAG: hypothetical protein LBN12_02705 [Clostridiales Family XIII bacterium]|nr:hypothetical protein [Clostridiales Family XIII bacterium]